MVYQIPDTNLPAQLEKWGERAESLWAAERWVRKIAN